MDLKKDNSLKFQELSVFVECSTGSTPTVATLKRFIDMVSAFGYTHLYLGLTDGYKMEGEPYFNYCRGGYTTKQLQELDSYAENKGMELRASFQVLAHLGYMARHDCYKDLFDTDSILMVGKEEVYQIIDKMFATMSRGIRSRTIHIGMDEAMNLGMGKYMQQHGYPDKRALFLEHLRRVVDIAKKYGYFCEMWSDMFYRMVQGSDFDDDGVIPEDVKDSIPEGVRIIHWSYEKQTREVVRKQIRQNRAICKEFTLAGAAWKCLGLAPGNRYSMDVMEQQLELCMEEGVQSYMVTLWSDNGGHCSIFAVLPTLFTVAEMARGVTRTAINKEMFLQIVGVSYDDFMLLDNLNNPFFKDLDELNARCYWGLLSDIFLGSYDMMLDEKTNVAYAALAQRYADVNSGEWNLLFEDFRLYAKVLSIKMNIGVQIREAYRNKNEKLLLKYVNEDIPKMLTYMEEFVEHFERRWLWENMAFGLEVHHLFYGGLLRRWKYEKERLEKYLKDHEPIEELEREYLPVCAIPPASEDRCRVVNYRYIISNCGI